MNHKQMVLTVIQNDSLQVVSHETLKGCEASLADEET